MTNRRPHSLLASCAILCQMLLAAGCAVIDGSSPNVRMGDEPNIGEFLRREINPTLPKRISLNVDLGEANKEYDLGVMYKGSRTIIGFGLKDHENIASIKKVTAPCACVSDVAYRDSTDFKNKGVLSLVVKWPMEPGDHRKEISITYIDVRGVEKTTAIMLNGKIRDVVRIEVREELLHEQEGYLFSIQPGEIPFGELSLAVPDVEINKYPYRITVKSGGGSIGDIYWEMIDKTLTPSGKLHFSVPFKIAGDGGRVIASGHAISRKYQNEIRLVPSLCVFGARDESLDVVVYGVPADNILDVELYSAGQIEIARNGSTLTLTRVAGESAKTESRSLRHIDVVIKTLKHRYLCQVSCIL